jgi:hypothetical protein
LALNASDGRARVTSRRHSSLPVSLSKQIVINRSPSLAVRYRRPAMTGDDWPYGTAAFHATFFVGEN